MFADIYGCKGDAIGHTTQINSGKCGLKTKIECKLGTQELLAVPHFFAGSPISVNLPNGSQKGTGHFSIFSRPPI